MTPSAGSCFAVHVAPSSLTRTQRGQVTGLLWLELHQQSFPVREWSDLPVAVMAMWSRQTISLLLRESGSELLRFMDGPFAVSATLVGEERVRLEALQDARPVGPFVELSLHEFATTLLATASVLLKACHLRSWTSSDLDRIELAVAHAAQLARGTGH
jgi:hypothetical protein